MSLTVYISNLEQVPKLKSKSVALIFHHFCNTKLYAHVLQFRVHTLILNTFHKIAHLEEIASWTVIGPDNLAKGSILDRPYTIVYDHCNMEP